VKQLTDGSIDPASWQTLSADEIARAKRFAFDRDRKRFVEGRALLRRLLAKELGSRAERIRFSYGPHGKPRLAGTDCHDIEFNLSHAENTIVVGIARGCPIGMDVEAMNELADIDKLAAQIMDADELRAFAELATSEQLEALLRVWTRKEAILKVTGTSLASTDPRSIAVGLTLNAGFTRVCLPDPPRFCRVCDLALAAPHVAALAIGLDIAFIVVLSEEKGAGV
jgi:4'-phosphopantetheinyl transferase